MRAMKKRDAFASVSVTTIGAVSSVGLPKLSNS